MTQAYAVMCSGFHHNQPFPEGIVLPPYLHPMEGLSQLEILSARLLLVSLPDPFLQVFGRDMPHLTSMTSQRCQLQMKRLSMYSDRNKQWMS